MITLIIFNAKKKSLRFDLAVIALLQVSALIYGCSVMFSARPVYNVFVVDRFEAIAANAIVEESRAKVAPEFRTPPLTGPRIVGARQPQDPQRMADIVLSASNGGPDLASYPDLYVPYAQVRQDAARVAKPLAELAKRQPQDAPVVRAFIAGSGLAEAAIGFLPMTARNQDMAMVVDKRSGELLGTLPVNPW